jgi:hypothetical protein
MQITTFKELQALPPNTLVNSPICGNILIESPAHAFKDGTNIRLSGYPEQSVGRRGYVVTLSKTYPFEVIQDPKRTEKILAIISKLGSTNHLPRSSEFTSYYSGCDPEIFVTDAAGEVIPAWTFLPSKDKKAFSSAFWDGFQAEFTPPPNSCVSFLTDSVRQGLVVVLNAATKTNAGAKLTPAPCLPVSRELLATGADEHIQFGCNPSFNAYDSCGVGVEGRDLAWRFAGSHKHFGLKGLGLTQETAIPIVKTLDKIYGVTTVSLFGDLDSPIRRLYYGRAGEYRLPSHGLEYRTISSIDLCHPAIYHLSWDLARMALHLYLHGLQDQWSCSDDEAQDIINNCDTDGSRKVLQRNKPMLMDLLNNIYNNGYSGGDKSLKAYNTITNSLKAFVADPFDVANNWHLAGGWTSHTNNNAYDFAHAPAEVVW